MSAVAHLVAHEGKLVSEEGDARIEAE